MRPIWKGTISFSLINIPIGLYPASRREDISFHMLRQSDLSPINYKRVAENDGREVPWNEIVKGYEYEPGKHVVMKKEDFERVDIEATQTIEIIDFVKLEEIDPIFYDTPYYLVPQKGGAKAYALLRDALKKTGRVGIAKVVIKTRQHLAAIKPRNNVLVLELMHFADELVSPKDLDIPADQNVGAKELDLAIDLIDRMTDKWDPSKYKDDYRNALLDLIHKKVEQGGKPIPGGGGKKKRPTNVVDLASILQESLAQTGKASARKTAKSSAHKSRKKAA
ncbi:MAG TPA: Ku protein [Verrucomicrobiae bacterium]|nr:Ku protein [Verrucomicrobiae bacterium]